MKRRVMAQQVADELFEAEAAIDAALIKVASLAGRLPALRLETNLSAVVGQATFDQSAKLYGALVQARQEIVALHHGLDAAKDDIGLRRIAFGGTEKIAQANQGLTALEGGRAA